MSWMHTQLLERVCVLGSGIQFQMVQAEGRTVRPGGLCEGESLDRGATIRIGEKTQVR